MGCGATKTVQAQAPQQPSTQDEINAWMQAMPKIYQMQMQYQLPMAQAQQAAQNALYPETSKIQENLAHAANEGMNSNVPDWMKQQYQSNMNAQLGGNAAAPIGADYMSRGLMQQNQDWKQYYQNLGLSVSGRQPLASPSLDYMSGFGPGGVMQNMNQNYGTSAGIYGNQLNYNQGQNQAMMNLIGSGIGAAGSAAMGAAMHSSIRYKRNVKLWLPKQHLN